MQHRREPLTLRLSVRLYRSALRLYPESFRRLHGVSMVQTLRDACASEYRRRGFRGALIRTVGDLFDLVSSGIRERVSPTRSVLDGVPGRVASGSFPRSPAAQRGLERRSLVLDEAMGNLVADFRFSFRMLLRQPTFALVAILTLALAIGANTVIFSVVKGVLIDPLPYGEPAQLVSINSDHVESGIGPVSAADFTDWKQQSEVITEMAAFDYWGFTFTEGEEPLDLPSVRATPALFRVLGVEAALGRTFVPEEGVAGGEKAALLSYGFWERHYGTDPSVIGRRVELDGAPHTIVGVMPRDFEFPPDQGNDIWTALAFSPENLRNQRALRNHYALARLRDGATIEQADEELGLIAARLEAEYPNTNEGWGARVRPAHQTLIVSPTGSNAIWLLFGAVGFLLLIACANVANLMLARLTARAREFAVRSALGAGRGHLIRQFVSETVLLSVVGGAVGLALALWGVEWIRTMPQAPLDRLQRLDLDAGVLSFTVGVSLAVGLIFGLLPARQASTSRLNENLKEAGGSMGALRGRKVLNTLVVIEVSLALVLLVGAGLTARSFFRLISVDPGFDAESVLVANVFIPDTLYPEDHQKTAFWGQVIEDVRAVPGVLSAGAVTALPMDYIGINFSLPFEIAGQEPPEGVPPRAGYRSATSDYFETMKITLLRGRLFDERDREDSPRVMIINDTLARRYFPDEDPIGEFISIPIGGPHEIIGVVSDVRHDGLGQDPVLETFIPFRQNPFGGMVLVARTSGDPNGYVEAVKSAIYGVDPQQPVYAFNTLKGLIAQNVSFWRLNMLLWGLFAAAALTLAAVGIYGLMSYSVTQRTRELGLRMALGAGRRDAMGFVIGRGMLLVAIGISLGLAASVAITRLLTSLLFEVSPLDPAVLAGVSLLFAGVALLASWIPARRATRVDPMVALRTDTQ